jgi:hypothetical protein
MVRRKLVGLRLAALAAPLLFAPAAGAQQASGIAGVVRDTSGAVLPGVTVEAASPALIEKVRSVVSDGEGRYNIVNLLPGTYLVTFSLGGFSTLKREGIVLTSGFTANVNADLQVGSLEETVTVTGATPLVDTQNVRKQTIVSSDLLNVLPSSTKHWGTLVEVTAGFTGVADVAGQLNQNLGLTFGRNLAACGTRTPCTATATVPLVVPGTQFDHRFTRLDLRLTKLVKVGSRASLQGNVDVYNVFNGAGLIQLNNAYGSQWRQPTELEDPRILQFSVQLNY